MEEQKSFTQRVKETVIHSAYLYKKYYVEYEYLLCSKAFEKSELYIIKSSLPGWQVKSPAAWKGAFSCTALVLTG